MNQAALVRDNNTLALALYRQLCAADGNQFFSPFSLASALAMTYAGARGATARQMAAALRFSLPPERLHPAFAALTRQVMDGGGSQLRSVNALWPQARYPLKDEFLALIRADYSQQVTALDYANAEAARQTINTWVQTHTGDMIKNLIPPGVLNPLVRLVLTNAIHFKGSWLRPFKPASTRVLPFQTAAGDAVDVPLMRQQAEFGYFQQAGLQILALPYQGGSLSMLVLLPSTGELPGLEAQLSPERLDAWLARLQSRMVLVSLPRFKFGASYFLNEPLRALGMQDAFDDQRADFSGMDGIPHWLFISAVFHKAFVDVNEAGTEAAAATAVVMQARSMPVQPVEFCADRPFLFLIRENSSGSILFIGRVLNPAAQEVP